MRTATVETAPAKIDARSVIYRIVAVVITLFFFFIGLGLLTWPFGWTAEIPGSVPDGVDVEGFRWYAGMFGSSFAIFMATPLAATIRRPRLNSRLLQYFLVAMAVVTVASGLAFGEFDLVGPLALVLLAATYPAPRKLISVGTEGLDKPVLGFAALTSIAMVPFVVNTLEMNTIDAGSVMQEAGLYWSALWILISVLIGGAFASRRGDGSRTLAAIIAGGIGYLGLASVVAPDELGSWGYLLGGVALIGAVAAIAYVFKSASSAAQSDAR